MRIAFIMMQKDEDILLPTWIAYHGKLADPADIVIIDNGSQKPAVREILAAAAAQGIRVVNKPSAQDFVDKGKLVQAEARRLAETHDWVFPLDCDEFVGVFEGQGFSTARAAIEAELSKVEETGLKIGRITRGLWNIPGTTDLYLEDMQKVVFQPNADLVLEKGFHQFDFMKNEPLFPGTDTLTNIGYMHFHNRHYGSLLESSRMKLAAGIDNFYYKTLQTYVGPGYHCRSYFLMDDNEYYESFKEPAMDAAGLFKAHGLDVPFGEARITLSSEDIRILKDPINLEKYYGEISMTRNEVNLFYKYIQTKSRYYEVGVGGTTKLACDAGVQSVVSVETDLDVCTKMIERHRLRRYLDTGRLELRHIHIGETKALGYPVHPPSFAQRELLVSQAIGTRFEVALLDGRYRVACAAAAYLAMTSSSLVMIHDYASRPHYHVVEQIFEIIDQVDELAVLRPRPDRHAQARELRAAYLANPH